MLKDDTSTFIFQLKSHICTSVQYIQLKNKKIQLLSLTEPRILLLAK